MKLFLSAFLVFVFGLISFSQEEYMNVCNSPDIPAQYYGGNDSIFAYIENNLIYPADALDESEEGLVVVEFIIERNGKLSNVHVVESVYPSLDREAIRLVREMTQWKPAVSGEQTCRSVKRIEMMFNLDFEKARRKKERKARKRRKKL